MPISAEVAGLTKFGNGYIDENDRNYLWNNETHKFEYTPVLCE